MLGLAPHIKRRRPSLTPMIDVVFLLLVFFMLAARFGAPTEHPLGLAGGGEGYSGPPRLVTVLPDGLLLNGQPVDDLPAALAPLMSGPTDTIILRPAAETDVQRLAETLAHLRAAGHTTLAVIE